VALSPPSPSAAQGNRVFFAKDLSAPDPVPETGIDAAVGLMRDGRLFRYGEDRGGLPEAALLEEEFAAYMGMRYAVGVNSCGCALFLALKSAGVKPGDRVLVNAFTLAPVPGSITHAGAEAVLVDVTAAYTIDIEDLERKAASSGARFLLLSYMRGHMPDMDALMQVCARHNLILIEDCAHTMGARWDARLSGTFGAVSCFSTQTFKHINSGEGGLLVTDDEDIAARAVLHSGSYMLYAQHRARPAMEVFDRHKFHAANFSMRMSGLVAAILRPQLAQLDARSQRWREIYQCLVPLLSDIAHIHVPARSAKEQFVPSSLQFSLTDLDPAQIRLFLRAADEHGMHIKWFGNEEPLGFTSTHAHWRYLREDSALPSLVPGADKVLRGLCDFRLPMWLSAADCATIAAVLREAMSEALGEVLGEVT
jgi:dTDP-4-amino-4,6-dideoxygalactose transaminase